jgi:benzoyl-CoA 2,3-dioxygenase component B
MVYMLHGYFGRDGREEADALLERRSGDPDKPRILDAFNETTDEWLSFFCFAMFADRDGKFQLGSLAESAFDPLARTCKFMLTEEAHHLFVGETGLDRVIRRSSELTKLDPNEDARAQGGIDLQTIQKWINYWYPYCLDLFGSEVSSNAADYFASGLKGRWHEARAYDEHSALGQYKQMELMEDDKLSTKDIPLRNAMNELLREDYMKDCLRALKKWNASIAAHDIDFTLSLPHQRFFRRQGAYANHHFDLQGNQITKEAFDTLLVASLPTDDDRTYVRSLMKPVLEPGKIANWISPPKRGINRLGFDFEYVRTDE